MTNTQSEYKDRLFHFIFGSEENREWALSLYNAINHTHYQNPALIKRNILREILYLGMHNDVSFLIYTQRNFFEQQSSCNPNVPLREMQYAGKLYEKYIKEHKLNKYGSRLIQLPVPRLVVFYNGTDSQPDELILQLTDSFPEEKRPLTDIEVRVRMININYGKSKEILANCRPLMEYAWLIEEIRQKKLLSVSLDAAVEQAIDNMPSDFLLKDFLNFHKSEVKGMLIAEYKEAKTMELFKEDGRKERAVYLTKEKTEQ